MPEGPTIVLLKEEVQQFRGKNIISATGNTKLDKAVLEGKKILDFDSWGKHFLIRLPDLTVRIHFMLFGSYAVNSEKENRVPRLSLLFENGTINFYSCSVKFFEGDFDTLYEWCADVMNDCWNPNVAESKLAAIPASMVCDAMLNQEIFSGVGNIIKNEVLHRIMVHPESLTGRLPEEKLKEMIHEARIYSFQFLDWKRKYELKQHYLAHTKSICQRCNLPMVRKHTGKSHRRSFFCTNCQILYK